MSANNDFSIPPKILKALYKQELNLKNNPV